MRLMKAFIVFAILIFSVGIVSAAGWDNVLDYENNDLTVKITNWLGLFGWLGLDDRIGTAELKSHLLVDEVRKVSAGHQVVMWYDFDFIELYENGLGEVIFTDEKTGKTIERDYSFVYWGNESYETPVYSKTKLGNGTIIHEQTGTETKTRETWLPYNSRDVPKGNIRIGLQTYVEIDDKVDGVWTIAGKKVKRHAGWTQVLNVDILSYWKFDDNDLRDWIAGENNGTNSGTVNTSGIINDGRDFEQTAGNYINIGSGTIAITSSNMTINVWAKAESLISSARFLATTTTGGYGFYLPPTGRLGFSHFGVSGIESTDAISAGPWYMVTIVLDQSADEATFYINATADSGGTIAYGPTFEAGDTYHIGNGYPGGTTNAWDGVIDEVGVWTRCLTPAEITQLYNGGAGISHLDLNIDIVLLSPANNENFITDIINFSANVSDPKAIGIQNVTLEVIYPNGTLFYDETNTSGFTGIYNFTGVSIPDGNWNWSVNVYDDLNISYETTTRNFLVSEFLEYERIFNNITYETASNETYNIKINTRDSIIPTSQKFFYDDVEYSATITSLGGNNFSISKTFENIQTISSEVIKTFYFQWNLDDIQFNSTTSNQTIKVINLTICFTGIPYVNFTFKDETTDTTLVNVSNDLTDWTYWIGGGSVTKNYIFSDSSYNPSYAFCFSPSTKDVITDLSFKYSGDDYPLRTFAYDDQTLTNSTTDVTLYLLSTADGIYSSVSVIESSGAPIQGASVTQERQFAGLWTIINNGITGSDGLVTFWNNPNFQHRITVTKSGYITAQVTITPSQTLYTLTLARTTGNATYISDLPGILWTVRPAIGTLEPGTTNFNVTVTSTEENLENCKFELLNATNISQVLGSDTSITNSSYCFITIPYTTSADNNIFGRLSLDTDTTTGFIIVDTDFKWILIDIDVKAWRGIKGFFSELKSLSEFGEGNKAEFSRIIFFFLILTIFIGVFTYFTGVEISSPGGTALIIWIIVLLASLGGFLTFQSGSSNVSPIIEQYGFAFIFTLVAINYLLTSYRKGME